MPDSSTRAHLLWSCLQVLTPQRHHDLLKVFGSLEEAAAHVDAELLQSLGCRPQAIPGALERLQKFDVDEEEEFLANADAVLIPFSYQSYPDLLKQIPDAPVFLYARGDFTLLQQPSVALVGTRRISTYGKRVTQEFTRALVQAGIVTVSGLAYGVDSLVALETMSAGGRTVAVLGQGLLTLTSRAQALADRIVDAGGLILSEFPLRSNADIFTFPQRNRIIAGLSLATIVLEAPESSGALITAKLAFDYNRDVFAVPGQIFDPNYAGCHAIIRRTQARLAATPRDVLGEIGVIVSEEEAGRSPYIPQNADEEVVLGTLTTMPQPVDALVEKSGKSAGTVSAVLTVLELNGAARNVGGGEWVRT